MTKRIAAAVAAAFVAAPAAAVSLATDGLGQALVFPYYSVQSSGGNAFNTYVSVVNHAADTKAVRLRVRESRNGREVASLNVFLPPNDVWTGAIVPGTGEAARLVSADRSCTSPVVAAEGLEFRNTFYSGALSDSNGEGLDRTREGWLEVIEMATLTGQSASNVAFGSAGAPVNCAAMQGEAPPLVAAPTGGLSGTLTLINVASGQDFTLNAEALADLATRPFYRPPADRYPDFNAAEIEPTSVVLHEGAVYRSRWNRPADAVSAVMMRSRALAEFVLDEGTRSKSDVVLVFPTRHHYVGLSASSPPFTQPAVWNALCLEAPGRVLGEAFAVDVFDREADHRPVPHDIGPRPPFPAACAAASVFVVAGSGAHTTEDLLGSGSRGHFAPGMTSATMPAGTAPNGWLAFSPQAMLALTSLTSSTRTVVATGTSTSGAHAFRGLPMMGFALRTFENGTLACDAGACQGNYGGAFPLKFRRSISP